MVYHIDHQREATVDNGDIYLSKDEVLMSILIPFSNEVNILYCMLLYLNTIIIIIERVYCCIQAVS